MDDDDMDGDVFYDDDPDDDCYRGEFITIIPVADVPSLERRESWSLSFSEIIAIAFKSCPIISEFNNKVCLDVKRLYTYISTYFPEKTRARFWKGTVRNALASKKQKMFESATQGRVNTLAQNNIYWLTDSADKELDRLLLEQHSVLGAVRHFHRKNMMDAFTYSAENGEHYMQRRPDKRMAPPAAYKRMALAPRSDRNRTERSCGPRAMPPQQQQQRPPFYPVHASAAHVHTSSRPWSQEVPATALPREAERPRTTKAPAPLATSSAAPSQPATPTTMPNPYRNEGSGSYHAIPSQQQHQRPPQQQKRPPQQQLHQQRPPSYPVQAAAPSHPSSKLSSHLSTPRASAPSGQRTYPLPATVHERPMHEEVFSQAKHDHRTQIVQQLAQHVQQRPREQSLISTHSRPPDSSSSSTMTPTSAALFPVQRVVAQKFRESGGVVQRVVRVPPHSATVLAMNTSRPNPALTGTKLEPSQVAQTMHQAPPPSGVGQFARGPVRTGTTPTLATAPPPFSGSSDSVASAPPPATTTLPRHPSVPLPVPSSQSYYPSASNATLPLSATLPPPTGPTVIVGNIAFAPLVPPTTISNAYACDRYAEGTLSRPGVSVPAPRLPEEPFQLSHIPLYSPSIQSSTIRPPPSLNATSFASSMPCQQQQWHRQSSTRSREEGRVAAAAAMPQKQQGRIAEMGMSEYDPTKVEEEKERAEWRRAQERRSTVIVPNGTAVSLLPQVRPDPPRRVESAMPPEEPMEEDGGDKTPPRFVEEEEEKRSTVAPSEPLHEPNPAADVEEGEESAVVKAMPVERGEDPIGEERASEPPPTVIAVAPTAQSQLGRDKIGESTISGDATSAASVAPGTSARYSSVTDPPTAVLTERVEKALDGDKYSGEPRLAQPPSAPSARLAPKVPAEPPHLANSKTFFTRSTHASLPQPMKPKKKVEAIVQLFPNPLTIPKTPKTPMKTKPSQLEKEKPPLREPKSAVAVKFLAEEKKTEEKKDSSEVLAPTTSGGKKAEDEVVEEIPVGGASGKSTMKNEFTFPTLKLLFVCEGIERDCFSEVYPAPDVSCAAEVANSREKKGEKKRARAKRRSTVISEEEERETAKKSKIVEEEKTPKRKRATTPNEAAEKGKKEEDILEVEAESDAEVTVLESPQLANEPSREEVEESTREEEAHCTGITTRRAARNAMERIVAESLVSPAHLPRSRQRRVFIPKGLRDFETPEEEAERRKAGDWDKYLRRKPTNPVDQSRPFYLFNRVTGMPRGHIYERNDQRLHFARFNPDPQKPVVLSGGNNRLIYVHNYLTGVKTSFHRPHAIYCSDAQWSPCGRYFLGTGTDKLVSLISVEEYPNVRMRLYAHSAVRGARFFQDTAYGVMALEDGTLNILDWRTRGLVEVIRGLPRISCIDSHPERPHQMVFGCDNGKIMEFDFAEYRRGVWPHRAFELFNTDRNCTVAMDVCPDEFLDHADLTKIESIRYSSNERRLESNDIIITRRSHNGADCAYKIAPSGRVTRYESSEGLNISCASFASSTHITGQRPYSETSREFVVTGTREGVVVVFDEESGREIVGGTHVIREHSHPGSDMARFMKHTDHYNQRLIIEQIPVKKMRKHDHPGFDPELPTLLTAIDACPDPYLNLFVVGGWGMNPTLNLFRFNHRSIVKEPRF